MSEARLVGLIFLLLGVVSILVGIFLFLRRRAFLRTAVSTQGTVTDIVQSTDSEGGTSYSRVVLFSTPDGRQITFRESSGWGRVKQSIGDPIPIRYQADRPDKAIIATGFSTWFWPVFPVLFGLAFAVPGFFMFVLGSDATDVPDTTPGTVVTSLPGTDLPTGVPTEPGGTLLSLRHPSGSRSSSATCDHVRDAGNNREFELVLDDGSTVRMTAHPYDGPGVYQGATLTVAGTFFEGATEPFSGPIIVDANGQAGSINLTSADGAFGVSGAWDCTGRTVEQG